MYAVLIDFENEYFQKNQEKITYTQACLQVKNYMLSNDFQQIQNGLYLGGETINAVTCVVKIQELSKLYNWFSKSLREIKLLRIEEINDLSIAIL